MAKGKVEWDRRRAPRVEVPGRIEIATKSGATRWYRVRDLSAGGVLAYGPAPASVDSEVAVILHLPAEPPIAVRARIVDDERPGAAFALGFVGLSADIEDAIHDVVLRVLEEDARRRMPEVLVVDDDVATLRAVARDLAALKCHVVATTSAHEAVDQLDSRGGEFDAAVVDLVLGNVDGLTVLAHIARAYPDIRRILISGAVRPAQLHLAEVGGRVHGVVAKPWTRAELQRIVLSS